MPKFVGRHLLAARETIHHRLISTASELDQDVVDGRRKPRVAHQCEAKRVTLFVAVRPFSERHNRMGLERVDNRRYCVLGCG